MISLRSTALPGAQIEGIGQAIHRLREAGKKVHVFAENYSNPEIMLGSYADETIMQAGGAVSLTGLHTQEMFLADTLAWIGVKADLVQIGKYKGANEMYMHSTPTKAWEANFNQLLDSLYDGRRAILKTNLHLTDTQLDEAMGQVWFANADKAIEMGLLDSEIDLPLLSDHLQEEYGGDIIWHTIKAKSSAGFDPANPFAIFRMLAKTPEHTPTRDTIAVLQVVGTIVDGDSKAGGLMGGESVGSRTIRRALEKILDEDLIKGVVVRIDSPGGSAIASEVMWQGLRRVAAQKPVWVSVGSMAASGGYYTAVGSEKIYVNPSSIVGSIWWVGGKFTFGGLYEKLHINIVSHDRGPRAGLFSTVETWTDGDRQFVAQKMTETYDLFTSRVAAGREGIDLSRTAEGRLFTGQRAIDLGMADEIGSLHDAVGDLAQELNLDGYDVMNYPGPKGLDKLLEQMLGGVVRSPIDAAALGQARMLEQVLGPRAWEQLSNAGRALLGFQSEPVQAVMPRVILFD